MAYQKLVTYSLNVLNEFNFFYYFKFQNVNWKDIVSFSIWMGLSRVAQKKFKLWLPIEKIKLDSLEMCSFEVD